MRRFLWLEQLLHSKNKFKEFANAIQEYFDIGHAQHAPSKDMHKACEEVFYLPIHAVSKASSTTSLYITFDASAKTMSGISLND